MLKRLKHLWGFLALLLFSCGSTQMPPPGGGPLVDLKQPEVKIRQSPVSATEFIAPFSFSTDVVGTGSVQRAVIDNNVGTVTIGGKSYPAAVYEKQKFGVYDQYQAVIADTDKWWIAWFYCINDKLSGIYVESTHGLPMSWEPTYNATCVVDPVQTHAEVALPPTRLSVDVQAPGYEVDGHNLSILSDGSGVLTHLGEQWEIEVFEPVECLTSDCGTPTWHALHSIVTKGDKQCFTIFYLMDDTAKPLQMAWSRCLPDFDNPFGNIHFKGSWSKIP